MDYLVEGDFVFHFKKGQIWRKLKWYKDENGKNIKSEHYKLCDTNHIEGYKTIMINGKSYFQHRLLYEKFHNIKLESNELIDHINQKKDDNRIENLRVVNAQQNNQNKGKQNNNTSGEKNICLDKTNQKWKIQISNKHYGYFDNIEDAIIERDKIIEQLNNQGHIYSV